jgi:CRP/FNR family transcriptional regulator, cyclic AMP receptor protein
MDVVSVFDADPDLAAGIEEEQLAAARKAAIVHTIKLVPPDWDPRSIAAEAGTGWLGLLVIDGLLVRRVSIGHRAACELFGTGDIIRPWDRDGEYDPLTITLDWVIPVPGRLAILDAAFARRVARWPTVAAHLIGRAAQRGRGLALTQAISHLPRVQGRLLLLFWLLAERWGKVGPDGVRVALPLTHELLAMVVGAGRPTVTTALQRLRADGLLLREPGGRWLLTNAGIEALSDPESLGHTEVMAGREPSRARRRRG